MTDADISLLNEACQTFEIQLINKYNEKELGQAYKTYLHDIQNMDVAPGFFLNPNSKDIMKRFKKSNSFDKIWIKLSSLQRQDTFEIVTADGSQPKPQNEYNQYCTNPNGTYLECLAMKNKVPTIENYLEEIKSMPWMSPALTAGLLNNLTNEEFGNELTRLIIAINFYYEVGLLFYEMEQMVERN